MTLQPLIENYFKHGADVQPGKGRIRISSQRTPDDWIQIRLENNGPCIPEEKLSEIQRWLRPVSMSSDSSQESDETESIGLRNVMRRLQLNSPPGYNATLTIGNLEPNGVEIIVKIYAGE